MRTYFEHLERIRKASFALRKEENTLPTNPNRILEVKTILNSLMDDYVQKWPEPVDGACSCSVEGSEGCRPKVCPNPECDTVIEGSEFCSQECAEEYADVNGRELPELDFAPSMHEAADRLNRRLKGQDELS